MSAGTKGLVVEPRGLDVESLRRSVLERLVYSVGKDRPHATRRDWFHAVVLGLRDRLVDRWMETTRAQYKVDAKRVYYLSLEFLIGRLLTSGMSNLGILEECRQAMAEMGIDLDEVIGAEPDAALGNGGLGRLAACFLDSMATLALPGMGYGIRYEFGLFEQHFERGWQVEYPEQWLQFGNPWEFPRPEVLYEVPFYGRVETVRDGPRGFAHRWVDTERVFAEAFDTPVVGYGGQTINTLRLWQARATSALNLGLFAVGDYLRAVEHKVLSENLSRVLYPNDTTETGRELRLKQEYFFTSASLQDILRRFLKQHSDFTLLPERAAIQLNDTHPAIGIAELMRLLVDHHAVPWDKAWQITSKTFSYTNHTLLPEALETWPVRMMERVLPRHMQIIYDINGQFLNASEARRAGDIGRLQRVSLIDERGERRVRMGNLAFIGSHKVNGVSALHTEMMTKTVFADLHAEFPDRINNKTNGITPRRWLLDANPGLARLVTERLGDAGWVDHLDRLKALAPLACDGDFQELFRRVKRDNKARLAATIARQLGVEVSIDSLFDVQVKRIHEYKRQLMNLLQTVALYHEIRDNPRLDRVPVTKIFAGKAAPSYQTAKLIIKLINDVAAVVNHDPAVRGLLKIAFLPNYSVTLAETIIPAADLSQQISTAGMEASGTGNMKLALNGALTIGTLDGANVEIREAVGPENIFIFGLEADQVVAMHREGWSPRDHIAASPALARALQAIGDGAFSPDDRGRFQPLLRLLTDGGDHFLVTADFDDYCRTYRSVLDLYRSEGAWTAKAVINTASVGWFSSDRTVGEYAADIWAVKPLIS